MNRLAQESSPYLLQHADNPVDWYPWGPEALAKARAENKPILLSIGYSSCHWCHVMAHESFENPEVAAVMNRLYVNIKVDREERPDLDQIYQTALQMLTRRSGGWPLTMFLAPDQTPFFGGTYFPCQPRFGLPGLVQVLESASQAWHERRHEIVAQGESLRAALVETQPEVPDTAPFERAAIDQAIEAHKSHFDEINGGYGGTPKFPRPADLEFLLGMGDSVAREQVLFTLAKMAEGGLQDQIGGGFFRYSVDEHWGIPHFEKMLYDNGPLLGLYADAWAQTEEPLFRRAAEMTVAWLEREMTSPEGVFHAALDADSEHEEGKFYVWTPDEVKALLSADEFAVAAPYWGLDRAANFEDRAWHLTVAQPLEVLAERLKISGVGAARRLESARAKLFTARAGRVRPGLDDKALTSWNALMIRGLAHAARRFGSNEWLGLAYRAIDALRARVWCEGRLLASYKNGVARINGYLDDHAFMLAALLETLQAGYRPEDMAWARDLADALLSDFEDSERGGFFFTRHDHEALIQRPKPAQDAATPSGIGMAALGLNRLGHVLGESRYIESAERAVRAFLPMLESQPMACGTLLTALAEQIEPPRIVVLRGQKVELAEWLAEANPLCPSATVMLAIPTATLGLPATLAKPIRAETTGYVCAGANCLPELVQKTELKAILSV